MILLRHGQSEFNLQFTLTRKDPGIHDPHLTPLGQEQAEAAAEAMAHEHITRIIVSPYTRTLQTAAPIAQRLGLPILVNPIVRERYAFSCDVGSPSTTLQTNWPQLDFTHIPEIWWPATNEPPEDVIARANLFRAEIAALQDWPGTLVICHWGFIMSMTGLSVQNGQWLRIDPTQSAPETIPWKHV